jgi:hypothetical protein
VFVRTGIWNKPVSTPDNVREFMRVTNDVNIIEFSRQGIWSSVVKDPPQGINNL